MNIQENPYIKRIFKTVSEHIRSGDERRKKIEKLKTTQESEHTTPHQKEEITRELSVMPVQVVNVQAAFQDAIQAIADEYIESVRKWGIPSSENLTDAAVLSGAIELTPDDLTALEEKHAGNETMARALREYAKRNDLHWMRSSPSPELKINSMQEICKYFADHREDGLSAQNFTLFEMGQGEAVSSFLSKHDAIIGNGRELKTV